MDVSLSPEEIQFQKEARDFYTENYTPELAERIANPTTFKAAMTEWQKVLADKGWVAPNWPEEHGGTNWTVMQSYLFEAERTRAGAPELVPFGLKMVGHVIIQYGNEEQKQRFLPRIYHTEDWWCQGYSEPGAGSDLAALKTRAELDGDHYVVNGAKIWTTYAQYADWIFCLVRTDSTMARRQDGISFLLIDMKSPGITVNKIETIDNIHTINEVVFDNVRVPVENLIGEQDKGWTYAKALLIFERNVIARVGASKKALEELKAIAKSEISGGKPLIEDPMIRHRFVDIEVELMALEYTELRFLSSNTQSASSASSILKLKGTEIQQAIEQLRLDLAGYYSGVISDDKSSEAIGHSFGDEARATFMYGRSSTILGGSNEVQRNIAAKTVLGL